MDKLHIDKLHRVRLKWLLTNTDTGESFSGVAYSYSAARRAWLKLVRSSIPLGSKFSVVYFDSNNCSLGSGYYELTSSGIDVAGDVLDHEIYGPEERRRDNKELLGSRFLSPFGSEASDLFGETSIIISRDK